MFYRLHISSNLVETKYDGQVWETPSSGQLKAIQAHMKAYLAKEKVDNPSWPQDVIEGLCTLRLLKNGNKIYAWLCPPTYATHSMMGRELGFSDGDIAWNGTGSGIRLADFDRYGYDIFALFNGTVGSWRG
jgi:hypothetical protein